MYPDPNGKGPLWEMPTKNALKKRGYLMGYDSEESLENTINTMGTRTLGVHMSLEGKRSDIDQSTTFVDRFI